MFSLHLNLFVIMDIVVAATRHATSTTFTGRNYKRTHHMNACIIMHLLVCLVPFWKLGLLKTLVDNDELKAIVEADDTQSTA